MSAEETALAAIQEQGTLRVRDLAQRKTGMPRGPGRATLERQVVEAKLATRLQFLRAKLEFARERGDLAAARQIEDVIANTLHPGASPSAPAIVAEKRGQR